MPASSAPASPYRLVRPVPPAAARIVPDEAQQAVLDHPGGPLLVLAGPGTGKTTTLVEAVARRVEGGLRPDEVLVLTFSRKAAAELRDRITARLGTPTAGPSAWTFHAFCYALVREHQPPDLYGEPLRLLSGPEQDVVLRDLLRGSLDLGRRWPEPLRTALTTRGLAEEVRALLSRAREVGLDPEDLAALAVREGREDWQALASFFTEYLDVLDAQGAVDYAELVHRAVLLAEQRSAELRGRYRAVFVDEYQDTDPAQERLLQALAGQGRDLVVVGDPDQAIYAFRGADVAGILRFRERFPTASGEPAPVLALQACRRSGAALLAVSRRVADRIPVAQDLRGLRELRAGKTASPGVVEVHTHPSVGAEADAIADLLRREHLERGTPWSHMAVLVRSGARSVPLLRRVLTAASVPIEVAGDEVPLVQEPAVAPLLLALRAAADPEALTVEATRQLLLSPLGGADPAALRRLGRELRALDRLAREEDGRPALPAPSGELLREAVADPRGMLLLDPQVARPAVRLAGLIAAARERLAEGPEAALWELWSGSPWPGRLERASRAGGAAGRAADRDLDAVVALFSTVARAQDRRQGRVTALLDELEAQQIPGDTLSEGAVRGDAVRLLTAHRSKGLEWELVVVAGVQEGVWPDLRRRSTLLESERLDRRALREPAGRAELLADERRLFYVALTRAKRRVVVTAVDSPEDDGDRPSRFLAETGVEPVVHRERGSRPLSLTALVASLRRRAVDPAASEAVRAAAAVRLARLAVAVDEAGQPLVPAADPDRWWGLVETTRSETPVVPADQPVALSGSSLQRMQECPLRWFLEKKAAAESASSTAMGFGLVVHALAHEIGEGRTDPELDRLMARLDTVWHQLAFEAPWQSDQQREQAREALVRLVGWHGADRGRALIGTERDFVVPLEVDGRAVELRGSMDRVESAPDGTVHVVDLKTTKAKPNKDDLAAHAQLGVYQLAVREGAVGPQAPGGAELVQLRHDGPHGALVQGQGALGEERWVDDLIRTAVQRVVTEEFPPRVDDKRCGRCAFARACPGQPEGRQVVQ
ncbi:MAG TPA: ATP-dependent DNA helicase [Mycobacteriales bacterium]|nr:ATP-dependent DNA helicase [Mycobacteriales bacterium]